MNCYYFYTAFDMLCHNFTCKTITMIQLALREKIIDIPKIGTIYRNFTYMLNMSEKCITFAL